MQLASFLGRVSSISFVALVLLPMGCGGSSSSGTQSTAPVPSSDFATRFAQSYCSSIKACCAQSGYATATCESSMQAQLAAALATLSADPNVLLSVGPMTASTATIALALPCLQLVKLAGPPTIAKWQATA